ncbi:hypothetical protein N5J40_02540 [Aeromonas caviae]|uniref:hypothetical protein n=1 Tax=Aeromonas caviae TaxID=648 RepID=UPI00244863DB|nr:hypothetical protein [Aeromonas caviae]MDH1993734.1 hypothetical protein [Aeromonas caviae]
MVNFDGILNPDAGWPDIPQASDQMQLLGGEGGPLNAQAEAIAARSVLLRANVSEALRRSYAEAGYNVVGTFQAGFTYVNANDVGIDLTNGKGYTGPVGYVTPGTDPTRGGFVDRSGVLLRDETFRAVTPDNFFMYGDDYLAEAAAYCKAHGVALHIPRGRVYDFKKRVTFDEITLLWEGTLNLTEAIDLPIVFRRQVTMPTYGYLKTDASIIFPDTFYMVGFYSSGTSPVRSYGCTDNIISGRLDIRNGHINYSINDQGVPDDIANLTGGGVLFLGGSWNRPSTGITAKTYEFVHKNNVNIFVDGFSYPLTLQGMLNADDPNSDYSTPWVNGNEINIKARRAKEYLRILSPLARPNGNIGGEVAGNVINAEFQYSTDLTQRWVYCQGRGNKITLKGWDPKPSDGNLLVFVRGNSLAPGVAEPGGNIIELLQATLPGIGESEFSSHVYEQTPGLNVFTCTSRRFANILPEEAPFSNSARQTASYVAKLDNFLAGVNYKPRNYITIYKNGVLQTGLAVERMFDFNAESALTFAVVPGDIIEIIVEFNSSFNHFNYIGQTLGYLTSGLGGRFIAELKDSSSVVKYTLNQNLRSTNTSGYVDVTNVKYAKFTYRDFVGSGNLNISSLWGKVYNKSTSSGIVTMHGCPNVVGDITFEDAAKGVILKDRTTGQRWRLYMNSGAIAFEAYNP